MSKLKSSLELPYKELSMDNQKWIAIPFSYWKDIQIALEHDFKVKMNRRV